MARVETILKGGHAQVEDRYTAFMNDQHGRKWTLNMSKRGGDSASAPSPTRWTAPLSPSYLRGLFVPPEQYRTTLRPEAAPPSLFIDYDGWVTALQSAQGHHDQTKVDVINHQAAGFDAIRLMENPPPSLLRIIGPGPFPPIEVVEEMAAGDAWALGQTDIVPDWFTDALKDQIIHTARQTGLFQTYQLRELEKQERLERKRVMRGEPKNEPKAATVIPSASTDITAATTWPQFVKAHRGTPMADVQELWRLHKLSLEPVGV